MDLLIFLEKETSRTRYVFTHVFNHIFGLNITFTSNLDYFLESTVPKMEYSREKKFNSLYFYSSNILFEDHIEKQSLSLKYYNNLPTIFNHSNSDSCLSFDPFAAIFYMLSRYEEYGDVKKDRLGRFSAKSSIAYKYDFLHIPIVDHWIFFIKQKLKAKFPNIIFKNQKFKFYNTIDVDNAFAYLDKGFLRSFGSALKDVLQLNFNIIKDKIDVLFYGKKDPYDNFDYLLSVHKKYNLRTIFFFLLADYGRYDRNVFYKSKKLQKKIRDVSFCCDIGIHTSFFSIKSQSSLHKEINRLENILEKKIVSSRQHYLYLNIPFFHQNLLEHNIQNDYSMGFPSLIGFRAGTSYNYYFYDLSKNKSTNLVIYPFCIMDTTLREYLKLSSDEGLKMIKKMIDEVKKVKGNFISIWHNESFDLRGRRNGWKKVYEEMIQYILQE